MADSALEDSISLGASAGVQGEEVSQPARKLGRLRKAGQLQQGENTAPNPKAAAGDSPAKPSAREAPESDQEEPSAAAGPQEASGEEAEVEAAAAEEPDAEPSDQASPALHFCMALLRLALHTAPTPPRAPCALQEGGYYDEEDELEEVFAKRATQKATAPLSDAEASAGAACSQLWRACCPWG